MAQGHEEDLARQWLRGRTHVVIHDDATSAEVYPYATMSDDELDAVLLHEAPPWW